MARGNNMPSIAQETTTATNTSSSSVPCKKRRRDDDRDNNQQFTLYASLLANSTAAATNNAVYSSHSNIYSDNQHHHNYHHGSSLLPLAVTARKMIPLPLSKRQRMTSADTVEIEIDQPDGSSKRHQQYHDAAPHSKSPTHQREGEQSLAKQHQPRSTLGSRISTTSSASLLTPCHICCRKPSKKSDLDSFADCQGCGQRTCYVCIRECLGWSPTSRQPPTLQTDPSFTMIDVDSEEQLPSETDSENNSWAKGGGHRKMVCSRCCVERGQDGDVVCLGCLPFAEG
ncbi:hypothetical protein QBC36DRAFT_65626 [Triangularia setosa]|uniref:Uncharacterized protein n=1 Tax=Triangularia setosa TaxID=2587417 RepID=A0AAN6WJK9_9PEZI|nr:hypothetical protein QBC36DRAFT_65626 [Podospora setosa]